MNVSERLQQMEAALLYLRQEAVGSYVLVEGKRDVDALAALGVGGEHAVVNTRGSLEDTVDAAAAKGKRVVILMDWDRTGGRLARRLHDGLVGRVPVDMECRRRLASTCHCKCIEDLPAELAALQATAGPRAQ